MKFFIFSCLVAVALAKHVIKQHSSSSNEEPANIFPEKFKQDNVFFQTSQEPSSSSSSEESAEAVNEQKSVQIEAQKAGLKQLAEKIKQLCQELYIPQLCQAVYQQQALVNPWAQIKTTHNAAILKKDDDSSEDSTNISLEEILKKIIDVVKISQVSQLAFPQAVQAIHPQQFAGQPWNVYPYAAFVRNF